MSRIGIINEGECETIIDELKAYFVNEYLENYPNDKSSPNYPRIPGRLPRYQNPLLGDPGQGEIARWHKVKASAVATLVDQMIAHFLMNRDWYHTVRCRESLWNMYRRLEWWVEQHVGLADSNYSQALTFIRDCIYKILDTGEDEVEIKNLKFVGKMLDDFVYEGDWIIDPYGYLKVRWEEGVECSISTIVNYENKGLLTFNFATEEYAEDFILYMDGIPIWNSESTTLRDDLFSFRDITIPIPLGNHIFKWEIGYGVIRFDEFRFVELKPNRATDTELPQCPPSYTKKYHSDYANYFDGTPYERAIFSTVGANGVSNPLDILRYVSSKENIEWDKVDSVLEHEKNENILKLPLDRLPETLSSKLTFNMRMKRKGYVTFKYLMESGGGSEVSLYINNRKATYDLTDTSNWEEVRINVTQSQTYKFDIVVHKSFGADIGHNAVFIKDVEVIEVTDYIDSPMPGDYTYEGEDLSDKWLIYSHRNALASYYRGFPDGKEDMIREFEFELYSECDGVFGFEHLLNTENPDRFFVEGSIFTEMFKFNENKVVWDGGLNGVDIPDIIIEPKYGNWHNRVIGGNYDLNDFVYWTRENTDIKYKVDLVGNWTRGNKRLHGNVYVNVVSPPKFVVKESYIENPNFGLWSLGDGWAREGKETHFGSSVDDTYGIAKYTTKGETGSYTIINLEEDLSFGEILTVYYDEEIIFKGSSGFGSKELSVVNKYGKELVFNIDKKPKEDLIFRPIFADALDFSSGTISDVRGREIELIGDVDIGINEWTSSSQFTMSITLKAGEEFEFRLPASVVPYVNQEDIDHKIGEIIEDNPVGDPEVVFYENFNEVDDTGTIYSQGGIIYVDGSEWEMDNIFSYLGLPGSIDDLIVGTSNEVAETSLIVILDNPLAEGKLHSLSFEYGARFSGKRLSIFADNNFLTNFTEDNLLAVGAMVTGVKLPEGTTQLEFKFN